MDILCFNPFNLKNKIMKIGHKKIFRGPSKILKNISWSVNTCLKYFMAPTKTLRSPSNILNVRSLNSTKYVYFYLHKVLIKAATPLDGYFCWLYRRSHSSWLHFQKLTNSPFYVWSPPGKQSIEDLQIHKCLPKITI